MLLLTLAQSFWLGFYSMRTPNDRPLFKTGDQYPTHNNGQNNQTKMSMEIEHLTNTIGQLDLTHTEHCTQQQQGTYSFQVHMENFPR